MDKERYLLLIKELGFDYRCGNVGLLDGLWTDIGWDGEVVDDIYFIKITVNQLGEKLAYTNIKLIKTSDGAKFQCITNDTTASLNYGFEQTMNYDGTSQEEFEKCVGKIFPKEYRKFKLALLF